MTGAGIVTKVKHRIGYYRTGIEVQNGIKLGVTRNLFGCGAVVGIWGGGPIDNNVEIVPASFTKKTMYDVPMQGKKVLIRADFNGTADKGGIKSETRIDAALDTIRYCLEHGAAQVILVSHNGRPNDEVKKGLTPEKIKSNLTLKPVANNLARKLGVAVGFAELERGQQIISDARVILIENSRLDARDESKKEEERLAYATEMIEALNPDIYIVDGFSVAHRDQASTTGLAKVMRQLGRPVVAGKLMIKEYSFFIDQLDKPKQPFVVVMGGAKVSGPDGKLVLIKKLLKKADRIVLTGAMLYPFLIALGLKAGNNPLGAKASATAAEAEMARTNLANDIAAAKELLSDPDAKKKLVIPKTLIGEGHQVVDVLKQNIPEGFTMRDVHMEAALEWVISELESGKTKIQTVLFNGPAGVFEKNYVLGTSHILSFISDRTKNGATTVIGGGETDKAHKLHEQLFGKVAITHKTTGGGASTELVRDGSLPAFEVLDAREKEGK
ncbi:MAG: phosphoglycerate kinase [Candidatus Margulisbacteria bacterium]|nr:phosphoglycerate kinase [Candidatus Margulisiibacteriota bacterium]